VSASDKNILYIFPGQGSQYPGIGSDLCEEYATARSVYDQASEVLGYDIADLSFRDPDGQINLTRFTQPALLTHSIACLQVFRDLTDDRLKPALAAGHSLGEYSALVAAGVLTFESALRLVQQRGELMGTYGEGEMSAFPLNVEAIRPIAERHFCAIAGCNLPEQTVIGGRAEDLEKVELEILEQFERARATRLKTEGAFHTYYMVEAAQHFRKVLDGADFAASEIGVFSNCTGQVHDSDPASIRAGLYFQLFRPVLWHANMQAAFEKGIDLVFEFGGGIGPADEPAGKRPNLQGMIKRILRAAKLSADYQAVINSATMAAASEFVNQD
jgi:[acyl-carrier-protein] S-malonyltransferase